MIFHDEMGELGRLKVKDAEIVVHYIGYTAQTVLAVCGYSTHCFMTVPMSRYLSLSLPDPFWDNWDNCRRWDTCLGWDSTLFSSM